ncbi:microtubule-associated protein RP/EB family member 1-like [Drosophila nasuta]|uniref:microtubule-associated protein RP/EB family member 1-like n=1 Tax=Drosophila nasuta TaxID=42062 RepID=UPI00295F24BD|nr:microtubule-associated protein RP/EB family member 1-like [Drosophila nasuta]
MSIANDVVLLKSDAKSLRFLREWIRNTLKVEIKTVYELRSGWVYCQIMHKLFPRDMPLSKVYIGTTTEREFEVNFFILKRCFNRLRLNRSVPVRDLFIGRGHYEFVNYIYKFYEANVDKTREYDAEGVRTSMIEISQSKYRRPIVRIMARKSVDPLHVSLTDKNRQIEYLMRDVKRQGSKVMHEINTFDLKLPGRDPLPTELSQLREKVCTICLLAERQYRNVEQKMQNILAIANDENEDENVTN